MVTLGFKGSNYLDGRIPCLRSWPLIFFTVNTMYIIHKGAIDEIAIQTRGAFMRKTGQFTGFLCGCIIQMALESVFTIRNTFTQCICI